MNANIRQFPTYLLFLLATADAAHTVFEVKFLSEYEFNDSKIWWSFCVN
jgi:hypothetical protein